MSREQFENERLYQITMSMARKMLVQGHITEKEYAEINTIFTKKYAPVFGTLFSDNSLT